MSFPFFDDTPIQEVKQKNISHNKHIGIPDVPFAANSLFDRPIDLKAELFERICKIAAAVRREKTHGIRESQSRGRHHVVARQIHPLNDVEPPAMKEHIHNEPAVVRTFGASHPFKPYADGLWCLAEQIGNMRASADDRHESPEHCSAARFDARGGHRCDISDLAKHSLGLAEQCRALFFPVQEIDDCRHENRFAVLERVDVRCS